MSIHSASNRLFSLLLTHTLPLTHSPVVAWNPQTDNLRQDGPGRVNTEETAEGLWIRFANGWTEIPRDECDAQQAGWKKQGFITWMGTHYNIGDTDDCSVVFPFLPMYHQGSLVALAFAPFGKYSVIERDWFENPQSEDVKKNVPHSYLPCIADWVKKYQARSFHFYLINQPRLILWDQSPTC